MFQHYLARWDLTPQGDPVITPTSRLLPVLSGGSPAMLRIALSERPGGALMYWWDGEGAARVLAYDGAAVLMEHASADRSLADLARGGQDDEASRILCAVIARLHAPRPQPPRGLDPLTNWFEPLWPAARTHGGVLATAAAVAAELLGAPPDATVLHGDIHHGNVLDFGERGWLAIDPKGLVGERYFDYANHPDAMTATKPGRLARQLEVVAATAGLDRRRLLLWILAWAGLSAAFSLEDGLPPDLALKLAEIAALELQG